MSFEIPTKNCTENCHNNRDTDRTLFKHWNYVLHTMSQWILSTAS